MFEHYQRMYVSDLTALEAECRRLGITLPHSENLSALGRPIELNGRTVANRLWLQPMQGGDADASGAPGALTLRRYLAYAQGGVGLVFVEATAVNDGHREHEHQLCLTPASLQGFTDFVQALRAAAREQGAGELVLVLQLSTKVGTDAAACGREYIAAAQLAVQAGFDGVDIKCVSGDSLFEALADRSNGQALAERALPLVEIFKGLHAACPDLVLTLRLTAYTAQSGTMAFGANPEDYRQYALSEPVELMKLLQPHGLNLVNLANNSPVLSGDGATAIADGDPPVEHPLLRMHRDLAIVQHLKQALPGIYFMGLSLSWLRHLLPEVAAGLLEENTVDAVGLGRSAMAYPNLAADILAGSGIDAARCCMHCFACNELLRGGSATGCVIRDAAVYGQEYRHLQRFRPEQLRQEAGRCHNCEHPPCMAASPSSVDIPACIQHFGAGRWDKAWEVIRSGNVFPEMSSYLSPSWLQAEGACVETILQGRPVPIGDIQLTLARWGRDSMDRGVRLPEQPSGRQVAVVGGGPAGLAATVKLLELGHQVRLIERDKELGGAPRQYIPARRFPDGQREIESVLQPALDHERLVIEYETSLGRDHTLESLQEQSDAVLLAVGLAEEKSLGRGNGVVDALSFLREIKSGARDAVPSSVAVLSGGDCAMDAAREARRLGAQQVYILYEGPRAEMHWHMVESWFSEPGVHCLILHRPLEYVFNEAGHLDGVWIERMEPKSGLKPVLDSRSVLPVEMAIEAMGLQVESALAERFAAMGVSLPVPGGGTGQDGVFACGALCNGGASVEQCIAEGMRMANEIDQYFGA